MRTGKGIRLIIANTLLILSRAAPGPGRLIPPQTFTNTLLPHISTEGTPMTDRLTKSVQFILRLRLNETRTGLCDMLIGEKR